MKKTAIVLANLGGPDSPDSVEPFLFNLFNDPAILSLPSVLRYCLARWIARKRAPAAREIYAHLGGRSPLVSMTEDQAAALDRVLNDTAADHTFKSFIAMRYWHPMSLEAAERIREFSPDSIIFLPLYPQYSTTTTGSSLKEWNRCARAVGLTVPVHAVCCYPVEPGWIAAQCDLTVEVLGRIPAEKRFRLLFSAHGLPKKIIMKGDPYQSQVEQTAEALARALGKRGYDDLDWVVCYQSRVGRLEWIGPSIGAEIERAARDEVAVVVVPVAFVSEHSETLVELDMEYRERAAALGISTYLRVPAVGTHEKYIDGLAKIVTGAKTVTGALPHLSPDGTMTPRIASRAAPRIALQGMGTIAPGGMGGMKRVCAPSRSRCPFECPSADTPPA